MKKIYDSEETLMKGLKAEQDTIREYTEYLNMAKRAGNESEVKLWEHIIADEQEHVKEFENALKGDFTLLDSNPNDTFIYNGKSYWCGSVNKYDGKIEEVHNYKEAKRSDFHHTFYFSEPQLLKMDEGENVFFYVDKDDHQIYVDPIGWGRDIDKNFLTNEIRKQIRIQDSEDIIKIFAKSPEQVMKEQEIDETFADRINDCLVDGGLNYKDYRITNEGIHFYVDFDSKKEEAVKAYGLLRDSFFKCDLVEDEEFFYVHVIRR